MTFRKKYWSDAFKIGETVMVQVDLGGTIRSGTVTGRCSYDSGLYINIKDRGGTYSGLYILESTVTKIPKRFLPMARELESMCDYSDQLEAKLAVRQAQ